MLTRHPEGARYFLAIAIELALKAYLLDRGISDDWNRVYLRHDLVKVLRFARRAGFTDAPAKLLDARYERYRHLGVYQEAGATHA